MMRFCCIIRDKGYTSLTKIKKFFYENITKKWEYPIQNTGISLDS